MTVGALRALFSVLLIGCLLGLPAAGAFAQEVHEPDGAETAVPDPRAPERYILLNGGDGAEAGTAVPAGATPGIGAVIRVLVTLAVVAAAIYGLVFLLKRVSRGRVSYDPFLKVLAAAPIGTNRGVYVVSVGSQAWLVGAAENGVHLISEITDRDVLDAMLLEDSRRGAESPGGRLPDFKAMLRRFGVPADSAGPSPESIRKRGERLKGL